MEEKFTHAHIVSKYAFKSQLQMKVKVLDHMILVIKEGKQPMDGDKMNEKKEYKKYKGKQI